MSVLFEEAIADAKKLRELAEENAKRAVVEALTPKIKKLIDHQLLNENVPVSIKDDNDEDDILLDLAGNDEPVVDTAALPLSAPVSGGCGGSVEKAGITLPDVEGKITLDLDSLASGGMEDEVELNMESIKTLASTLGLKENLSEKLELEVLRLSEEVSNISASKEKIDETSQNNVSINEILSKIENTYFRIREEKNINSDLKLKLEEKLENLYSILKEDENKMSLDKKQMNEQDMAEMNEEDLVLKLTGLPDELDLDGLDVELEVAPEEEVGDSDELELEPAGEEEVGGEDMSMEMDMSQLSDDDVVEVSESMLRQEIARMKKLNEEGPGGAPGEKECDDFGGGKKDKEPFVDMKDEDLNKLESLKREFAVKENSYKKAIGELKSKLDESNLFNAKLLYTNKLLQKNVGLSKAQKVKVVESFDAAKSVREVKLLFKSLTESLSVGTSEKLDESVSQRRVLGSSSRATKSAGVKDSVLNLNEGASMNRWALLAGLGSK